MSVRYEFNSTLDHYTRMIKKASANIQYAKEQVEYSRRRRVISGFTDEYYHWHLNHAGVFRRNAKSYSLLAKMYRDRLLQITENRYYDGVSAGIDHAA